MNELFENFKRKVIILLSEILTDMEMGHTKLWTLFYCKYKAYQQKSENFM